MDQVRMIYPMALEIVPAKANSGCKVSNGGGTSAYFQFNFLRAA
jgi:hypothetical protein